jgi:hypothetical protein
MIRKALIQRLLKSRKEKNYLEIGVSTGRVFFSIRSASKHAVDPYFKFSRWKLFRRTLINPANLFNKYYPITSDEFFEKHAHGLFDKRKIDISLVDGMHEYLFALRDIENVLKYLKDDGVIIIHDCNPVTKNMGSTFDEWKSRDFSGEWNGDVWKAILHLRCSRSDVHVFVLDCDYGLGVVTKGKPENNLNIPVQSIQGLTYEDFDSNRESWLNLKPLSHFYKHFQLEQ